jgi:hypothetical protein
VQTEFYLLGTQPVQFCPLHQGGSTEIAGWGDSPPSSPGNGSDVPVRPARLTPAAQPPGIEAQNGPVPNQSDPSRAQQKKPGFLDKFKSIFKNQ